MINGRKFIHTSESTKKRRRNSLYIVLEARFVRTLICHNIYEKKEKLMFIVRKYEGENKHTYIYNKHTFTFIHTYMH